MTDLERKREVFSRRSSGTEAMPYTAGSTKRSSTYRAGEDGARVINTCLFVCEAGDDRRPTWFRTKFAPRCTAITTTRPAPPWMADPTTCGTRMRIRLESCQMYAASACD
jgi:hypothetical protein